MMRPAPKQGLLPRGLLVQPQRKNMMQLLLRHLSGRGVSATPVWLPPSALHWKLLPPVLLLRRTTRLLLLRLRQPSGPSLVLKGGKRRAALIINSGVSLFCAYRGMPRKTALMESHARAGDRSKA